MVKLIKDSTEITQIHHISSFLQLHKLMQADSYTMYLVQLHSAHYIYWAKISYKPRWLFDPGHITQTFCPEQENFRLMTQLCIYTSTFVSQNAFWINKVSRLSVNAVWLNEVTGFQD